MGNRGSKRINLKKMVCVCHVRCSRKRCVFSSLLHLDKESAFWMRAGRLFHQQGAVNKNVLESDFLPLSDGTASLIDQSKVSGRCVDL